MITTGRARSVTVADCAARGWQCHLPQLGSADASIPAGSGGHGKGNVMLRYVLAIGSVVSLGLFFWAGLAAAATPSASAGPATK
jgi:hypothetical protein